MGAIVLIGAGASHSCESLAAPVNEAWRPPLTRELFSGASRPEFMALMEQYRGVKVLAPRLAELAREQTFSMEEELTRLAHHQDPRVRRHFLDIPPYLESVMHAASCNFTAMPGAYLRLVQTMLAEFQKEVSFVSLNYDLLLENALQLFDPSLRFTAIEDYCSPGRSVILVKPHGSIGWKIPVTRHDVDQPGVMDGIVFPPRPWHITIRHQNGFSQDQLYPALTAPIASKSTDDMVCPKQHVDVLRERCNAADRLLIIGSSCLDSAILQFIKDAMPARKMLTIVGKGDLPAVVSRVSEIFTVRAPYLEVHDEGFHAFLATDRLEWFCKGTL